MSGETIQAILLNINIMAVATVGSFCMSPWFMLIFILSAAHILVAARQV